MDGGCDGSVGANAEVGGFCGRGANGEDTWLLLVKGPLVLPGPKAYPVGFELDENAEPPKTEVAPCARAPNAEGAPKADTVEP